MNEPSNEKRRVPKGVPASETLYLPPYYSDEIRGFQSKDEEPTRNLWKLEELMNFVFPKKYSPVYYEVSYSFMNLLCERTVLRGGDVGKFLSEKNVSKATFYNRVLPRLRRVGMIKIERETIVALDERRKYRPMKISLSKTFGNYLMKIGDSWLATVDDARSRKQ